MPIEFQTNQGYLGQPINIEGVTQNPYRALDEISGCNDSDDRIARLGDLVRKIHDEILSIAVLTPADVPSTQQNSENALATAMWEVITRLPPKEDAGFFVMGQSGRDLYQSTESNE